MNAHRLHGIWLGSFFIVVCALCFTGCQTLSAGGSGGGSGVVVSNASLAFGTVASGSSKTLPDTLTNTTAASLTISSITGSSSDLQVLGISPPLALGAGQSVAFSVQFHPSTTGNLSRTISLLGANSSVIASLTASGTSAAPAQLSPNPSSVAFGSVKVGSSQTTSVTLSNTGGTDLTVNQATLSGAGFSTNNLSLPLTLHAGGTASLSVTFAPTGSGNFTGTVTFATNSTSNVVLPISGTGVASGQLAPNPSSLTFGNVQVGNNSNQSGTLTNGGGTSVTISQANVSGTGFSLSGLTVPVTLAANQSVTFKVSFGPKTAGAASGTLAIVSDAPGSPLHLSLSGTGLAPGSLTSTPGSASFGNVTDGTSKTVSLTFTNTGGQTVTVASAAASGSGFSFTGPNLPVTVNAGQSTTFSAIFAPITAGAASGTLTINSNATNATLSVPLSGAGVTTGQLSPNPSSFGFGNVQVGSSKSLSETLTNSGGTALTISAATASGSGFSLSGSSLPVTLNAGQSTSFTVLFAPTASGAASGNVSITSSASNSNLTIALSGMGVATGQLSPNPSSFGFGNVQVGSSKSLSETLTNSGGTALTISAATASGSGFSLSGSSLPVTLNAGQSTSFTVLFAPTTSGAASGSISITSTGANPSLSIPLSGTGVGPGTLAANPASLPFGSVQVGNSSSKSETLTNTGGSAVTISQANINGGAFSVSGLTLPATLSSNQSVTFTVTFAPTSAGLASGTVSIISDASNSAFSVALSGTGTAPGKLAVSPATLSFGNVVVGSSSSLNGTLNATGVAVTISSDSIANEFALSGITLPATIAAGTSASFTVTFTPQSSGAVSGSLSFTSNATNSPAVQSLNGTGTAPPQHSVNLNWNSSANAVGYNVYRGSVSGGPYSIVNTSLDGSTAFADNSVVAGRTYYYVVTAVDGSSNESGYSNETSAVIPTP